MVLVKPLACVHGPSRSKGGGARMRQTWPKQGPPPPPDAAHSGDQPSIRMPARYRCRPVLMLAVCIPEGERLHPRLGHVLARSTLGVQRRERVTHSHSLFVDEEGSAHSGGISFLRYIGYGIVFREEAGIRSLSTGSRCGHAGAA